MSADAERRRIALEIEGLAEPANVVALHPAVIERHRHRLVAPEATHGSGGQNAYSDAMNALRDIDTTKARPHPAARKSSLRSV